MKLAKEMGPGHTIVTILYDLDTRYQSKMYNVKFCVRRICPIQNGWMKAPPPLMSLGFQTSLCN